MPLLSGPAVVKTQLTGALRLEEDFEEEEEEVANDRREENLFSDHMCELAVSGADDRHR